MLRKIKIIYFLKSIISPVHIEERKLIFENFFKYFYYCFLEKKKQNIIVSYPSSGWNYFNTIIKGYVKEEGISNDALIFAGINEIPFFGLGSIKKNKKIIISRNYITSIFSYYKKYKREISFDEFIFNGKSLKRLTDFYNSWSSNVDENENLYIVKYENLKNNPIKYFEEAIKFLNIDQNVDKQKLEKVLEEMSFEKIKVNKEDVFLGGDNYEKLIKKETLKYIKKYLEKHLNLKTKINFNYDII